MISNQTLRRLALAALLAGQAATAAAQDASLLRSGPVRQASAEGAEFIRSQPLTLEGVSLLYTPPQPVRVLQLRDILTVVVNVNSRMQSDGDVENRKRSNLDAILADWIVLNNGKMAPDIQIEGDPRLQAQLNSQFRAEGDMSSRNTLTFSIAAQVVDVRPNGGLVIEARKEVTINDEVWERSLTGVIRREDVTPDNKVQSEDIANLRIHTRETGQVRDGYKRGWLQRFYDRMLPF